MAHRRQEIRLRSRRGLGNFDRGLKVCDFLSFGDVDDRRNHRAALGGLDRVEADFDGELASVAPATVEVAANAHKTGVREV